MRSILRGLTASLACFALVFTVGGADVGASCNILDYGADATGRQWSTPAIQKAIDACNRAGGGNVIFPRGRFRSNYLELKSNVTLQFEPESFLVAPLTYGEYAPFKSLIRANHAEHVGLRGPGVIMGQGARFWNLVPNPTTWHTASNERPSPLVQFKYCRDVTVDGITITNAPSWTLSPWGCTNVTIRNVTIRNDIYGPNTDGIDLCQCQDVVVSDCRIVTGDDAIVIKNKSEIPAENVSRNITVTRCYLTTPSYALKIGTESRVGIFENISWTDCRTYAGTVAWGMHSPLAIESVDGATIRHVRVARITCDGARSPIFIRLGNRGTGQTTSPPRPGSIQDVVIEDVSTTPNVGDREFGIQIHGVRDGTLANIILRRISMASRGGVTHRHLNVSDVADLTVPEKEERYPSVDMFGWIPAHGIYCRHVQGLTLENIDLQLAATDVRPALVLDDVRDVTVRQLQVVHPGIEMRSGASLHRIVNSPGVQLSPRAKTAAAKPGWVLSNAE